MKREVENNVPLHLRSWEAGEEHLDISAEAS
jgi:hypothetical protein